MELTSILSIPRGPRVERTVSATTFAAVMLFLWASLPVDRPVPSFRMSTGTPWVPCADISIIPLFESEIENKGETGFLKVYLLDNSRTAKLSTTIGSERIEARGRGRKRPASVRRGAKG